MKKLVFIALLTLFLLFGVKNAIGTSITSCSNLNASDTYYLTTDITNSGATVCMNISADTIILDCQNYKIDGTDSGGSIGVLIGANRDGIQIRNCEITDWDSGIQTNTFDTSIDIFYDKINSNYYAIDAYNTWDLDIDNTEMNNNYAGLWSSRMHGIIIGESNINYNQFGVFSVENDNWLLIWNNTIKNNVVEGIDIGNSVFSPSDDARIYENFIMSNGIGVYFNNVTDINIYENYITESSSYGIRFYNNVQNNKIYNNLLRNTQNTRIDFPLSNSWNIPIQNGMRIYSPGLQIAGNYWTNPSGNGYSDTCTDADSNGFCDSSFTVATSNIDNYPMSWIPYLTLTIRATQEGCNKDSDGCMMDVPNALIEIYQGSTLIASGTPNVSVPNIYRCGALQKPAKVISFLLPSGLYTVKSSASGYKNYSVNINLQYSRDYTEFMNRNGFNNIWINLRDSLTNDTIDIAYRCLRYSNGTIVPDGYPDAYWCENVAGYGIYPYYCVPTANYYYTFESTGYAKYTSNIFTLNADREDWVYMSSISPGNFSVQIGADKISGAPGETFTITYTIYGGQPTFYPDIRILDSGGQLQIRDLNPEQGYQFNKSIVLTTPGITEVWSVVKDYTNGQAESNHISINVIGQVVPLMGNVTGPIPQINQTEWNEQGYGWLLPIFTPMFIYTFIMAISAIGGSVVSKQVALGAIIAICFIGVYTYYGIYPTWLGFVLIILAGFILMYFLRNVIAG